MPSHRGDSCVSLDQAPSDVFVGRRWIWSVPQQQCAQIAVTVKPVFCSRSGGGKRSSISVTNLTSPVWQANAKEDCAKGKIQRTRTKHIKVRTASFFIVTIAFPS
jgi:hypothetical protein